jgi:hypothetical protein
LQLRERVERHTERDTRIPVADLNSFLSYVRNGKVCVWNQLVLTHPEVPGGNMDWSLLGLYFKF